MYFNEEIFFLYLQIVNSKANEETQMKKLSLFILFFLLISQPFTAKPLSGGDEEYLAVAEEMPAPVGGLASIMKKISYPEIAKRQQIQGKVFLLAYIDEKGKVNDVKVIRGIGGGCDEAAAGAVKKSSFTPGKNKGVAVKVKLSLAISFKL